jgi:hypothetical protein
VDGADDGGNAPRFATSIISGPSGGHASNWPPPPTASLAEAMALGADPNLVDLLQSHAGCVVITSTTDWAALGRFLELTLPGPNTYGGVPTILLEKPWAD